MTIFVFFFWIKPHILKVTHRPRFQNSKFYLLPTNFESLNSLKNPKNVSLLKINAIFYGC